MICEKYNKLLEINTPFFCLFTPLPFEFKQSNLIHHSKFSQKCYHLLIFGSCAYSNTQTVFT
jgi:hypothetical protein